MTEPLANDDERDVALVAASRFFLPGVECGLTVTRLMTMERLATSAGMHWSSPSCGGRSDRALVEITQDRLLLEPLCLPRLAGSE
jgi:hypothetical protein